MANGSINHNILVIFPCLFANLFIIVWGGYYAALLPFFILAFPLKCFIFGFNSCSFLFLSQSLASIYVCFSPQMQKFIFNSGEIEKIEPENVMSVVPFLVEKRKKCNGVDFFQAFLFCSLFFMYNFLLSLPFWISGTYF